MSNWQKKPLGRKNYGTIPHLPDSRMGPGDHKCSEGQDRIATFRKRDKHDHIIVQEKLDGSNVGIALKNNRVIPITRAGYEAVTSPHEMHWVFAKWVYNNEQRFWNVLNEGERIVGEWLYQAHGTKYNLPHEPFVAFDIMTEAERLPWHIVDWRLGADFILPHVIHMGGPLSIKDAMKELGTYGFHGAIDPVEGAVWRVERDIQLHPNDKHRVRKVDFLVKYVRPDKEDGKYLKMKLLNQFTGEEIAKEYV